MPIVEARLKVKGKSYEISVDFDEAMKVRTGKGDVARAMNSTAVYHDVKKGESVRNADLQDAFGTTDIYAIAAKIMKEGEIQKPQEYRDAQREARIKQVVDLIVRNAVDQHGKPYTEERIRRAIDEIHYSFDNRPAEQQMPDVVEKMKRIIPIRIDTKKVKLTIPASYTGQIYGILQDYKESEEWKDNGDLVVVVNLPAGMQLDFYDKLNNITHGTVQSEEITD